MKKVTNHPPSTTISKSKITEKDTLVAYFNGEPLLLLETEGKYHWRMVNNNFEVFDNFKGTFEEMINLDEEWSAMEIFVLDEPTSDFIRDPHRLYDDYCPQNNKL